MKKVSTIILIVLFSSIIFLLGFQNKKTDEPNTYYQVYLDDQVLGTIPSKDKLEKYIDERGSSIKKQYGVSKVYPPNGLDIRKVTTYHSKLDDVREVYEKLEKLKPFTIKGYQFSIKKENDTEIIYVTDKQIFKDALKNAITTFVPKENYKLYLDDKQTKIETTGNYIDNVYISEDITFKETQIPVSETIYNDVDVLSKYILFGTVEDGKTYTVKIGDTIDKVARNNKINVTEFLIANPEFTNENNLLFPGQVVSIGVVNPRVSVVVEETSVQDAVTQFKVETKEDYNMVIGDEEVIQKGENGLNRVLTITKTINGNITYVDSSVKEELKPMIPKIIVIGKKYQSGVGGKYWSWPTEPNYMLTSNYDWRYNPFTGLREHHKALDIAGPGYGSRIYAGNNGVVTTAGWHYSYGNYVIINHNNGYYTLYGHMSRLSVRKGQTVGRGQVIGYMGMTGDATGPHLHYELWVGGPPWGGGININPWTVY